MTKKRATDAKKPAKGRGKGRAKKPKENAKKMTPPANSYKAAVKDLFVNGEMVEGKVRHPTLDEIVKRSEIAAGTVYRWSSEGKWKEQRDMAMARYEANRQAAIEEEVQKNVQQLVRGGVSVTGKLLRVADRHVTELLKAWKEYDAGEREVPPQIDVKGLEQIGNMIARALPAIHKLPGIGHGGGGGTLDLLEITELARKMDEHGGEFWGSED